VVVFAAITSGAMVISGGCCLASPFALAAAQPVLVIVLLVWGVGDRGLGAVLRRRR
jgi:hypothetical protein